MIRHNVTASRIVRMLVDQAIVESLVPWPCPSLFGPEKRYRLEEVVAATPHSLLYRATDLLLSSEGFDASVAIKIARHPIDSTNLEAVMLRRIKHPNVLSVLGRGIADDGLEYVVSEYIEGTTLDEWTRRGDVRACVAMAVKIARGMQAAHTAGVCHLDLKPGNVLLTSEGEPKIADFGMAELQAPASSVTQERGRRGNLAFMAPEQFMEEPTGATPAADIYAIGGLLYWMISGQLPHGADEVSIDHFHRSGGVITPLPSIDRSLWRVIARAMSPAASDRHRSAGELADDLHNWLTNRPIPWQRPSAVRIGWLWVRRNPLLVALIALGVAVLGGGAGTAYYLHDQSQRVQLKIQTEGRIVAEYELEKIKKKQLAAVTALGQSMFATNPRNLPNSLVWLNWLTNVNIIDESGTHAPPKEMAIMLDRIIASQEADGQEESIESLMARHALAFVLVEQGLADAAGEHLKRIRTSWSHRVDPNDAFWSSLDVLEWCNQLQSPAADPPESSRTAERKLREYLKQSAGDSPLDRLVRQVLRRSPKPELD